MTLAVGATKNTLIPLQQSLLRLFKMHSASKAFYGLGGRNAGVGRDREQPAVVRR
jgi:hypothetical protein